MKHEEYEYEGFPRVFQELMHIQHEAAEQGFITDEQAQANIEAYIKGYLHRRAYGVDEEE